MTAARYDITIDQGSDFSLELIVKESGNEKDFSDRTVDDIDRAWSARAKFRKTLENETDIFNLNAAVTRSNEGKLVLTHPHSANPSAVAGTYFYDLEIFEHEDGDTTNVFSVKRLLSGNLTLRREVTR